MPDQPPTRLDEALLEKKLRVVDQIPQRAAQIDAPLFEDAVRQNLGLRIVPKTGPYELPSSTRWSNRRPTDAP